MKRLSLRDFASSGHVSTLAIAKVRQNAFCCLILIFQRTIWLDFRKVIDSYKPSVPSTPPPPPLSQTFQSQALIKMATVSISELVWTF